MSLDNNKRDEKSENNIEYYSQFLKNHPDAVFIISNEKIVDCNNSALKMFDFICKEEVLGLCFSSLSPKYQKDGYQSKHKIKNYYRITLGNSNTRFNWVCKKTNGEKFDTEVILISSGKVVDDTIVALVKCVGHSTKTYEAKAEVNNKLMTSNNDLSLHNTYFEQLFNSSPHGIVIVDNDYKVKNANSSFRKMFLYELDEILDKSITDVVCPQGLYEESHSLISKMNNALIGYDTVRRRKNGKLIHVAVSVYPIKVGNNEKGKYIIYADKTEERIKERKIEFLSYRDSLTKLYNKDYFYRELENKISSEKAIDGKKIGVLLLDINEFKSINDNLGHLIGDEILKQFADRIKEYIGNKALIARYGGDEFIAFIPDIESKLELLKYGIAISKLFKSPFEVDNKSLLLSASMGLSLYPDHGDNTFVLIQNAEIAMYNAKESKASVSMFDKKFIKDVRERFLIDHHLRYALENNEFFLNYQPIIDSKSEKILGVEALVRWHNKKLGIVPPSKFIDIAESNGIIITLGEWVLREACAQLKNWRNAGYKELFMSINTSIKQLEQWHFANIVETVLDEFELDPDKLVLEITETAYMENHKRIYNNIKKLNDIGVKLSIDDFGTGYSSLGQLKSLEISKLKIDKSFIQDINIDNNNRKIVSAIIAMAKSLNLNIIAEGVERVEHISFLKENGCDMLQGYYYSRPVTSDEIEKLIINSNN